MSSSSSLSAAAAAAAASTLGSSTLPPSSSSSSSSSSFEPIGARRNSLWNRLLDVLAIVWEFVAALLARFRPAQVVRIGSRAFTVVRPLGEGGFSYVYLVRETTPGRSSSTPLALKRVRIQLPEHEARLRAEIAAHAAVNSPHVIRLLDSAVVRNPPRLGGVATGVGGGGGGPQLHAEGLLLLPYMQAGTVQDLIDRTPARMFLELPRILRISLDVCAGLRAFHTRDPPLAFRDLKPANILLDDDGRAVLMDLGSVAPARVRIASRREAVALQELCAETVTAPFRAPELFDPPSDLVLDERSDVWALGCTVFAMAYRTSPFDGSMTAAVSGQVVFPTRTDPYGPAFRNLIRSVLVPDIKSRPTLDAVADKLQGLLTSVGGV
ncbi:kinase-like domain-containing protein [Zopfochytrium polystomum]|nr:kinase-like domain-containing protein [Zopfochytrium polystomum]